MALVQKPGELCLDLLEHVLYGAAKRCKSIDALANCKDVSTRNFGAIDFSAPPPELANKALDEFVILPDTLPSYDEMTSIFERASPDVQQRIVQPLRAASPLSRQIFAGVLYDRGLDVTIPDTEIRGLRSWER